jgi:hypothetical protein
MRAAACPATIEVRIRWSAQGPTDDREATMSDPVPFPLDRVSWAAALTHEHRLQMLDELDSASDNEAPRVLERWREIALRDAARRRLAGLHRAG